MAEALINSTRFGSQGTQLRRKANVIPSGGGSSVASLDSFIPLQTQLAFNRGEIPGSTYGDIVKQAMERAVPGSSVYNQLLKEESQAVSKARKEGRTLRELQVESKVANTPGNTAQDSVDIYNFWVKEAQQAIKDGDQEYYLTALKNAGQARDTAEKRAKAESNKYVSASKKVQQEELKAQYNEWQTDDNAYKKGEREIEENYQKGIISGNDRDVLLYQLDAVYSQQIKQRKQYLGDLQQADINSMGGHDVQTLTQSYETALDGNLSGTDTGLNGKIADVSYRVNHPDDFVDVVQPKKEDGFYTGETESLRLPRSAITSTPSSDGVFIRDDYGRYIKLELKGAGEDQYYEGFAVDPTGKVVHLVTNNVDPDTQKGAQGLEIYVGDSDKPVANYSAFVGPQANDQFDIFGKQSDDQFLQKQFNLDSASIASIKQQQLEEQKPKGNLVSNFIGDVAGGARKLARNIVALPEYQKLSSFPGVGPETIANNPDIPKVTQQEFDKAVKLPSIPIPKPINTQPLPKFVPGKPSTSILNTPPPVQVGSIAPLNVKIAPSGKVSTPSSINLSSNLGITGNTVNDAIKALKGTAYGGDIYVDKNEYNTAVKKYGQSLTDQAFKQGGFKKYKW